MTRVRLLVLALISVLTVVVTVQAWTEAKSADSIEFTAAECTAPSIGLRSLSGSSTAVGGTAEFEATVRCAGDVPGTVPEVLFSVASQDGNNPDLAATPGTPAGTGAVRFSYTRSNAGQDSITATVTGSAPAETPASTSAATETSAVGTSAAAPSTTPTSAPSTTPGTPRATTTVTATETTRETATVTATTTATATATATVTETATVTATATVTETATVTLPPATVTVTEIPPPVVITVTEIPPPVVITVTETVCGSGCIGRPAAFVPAEAQGLPESGTRSATISHAWVAGADQVSCRLDGGLSPSSADDVTFLCGGCPADAPVTIGVDGQPVSAQVAPAVDEVGIQTTLPDLSPGTHTATVRCGESDTDVEFGVVGTTLSSSGAGGSAGAASAVLLFFILIGWMLLPRIRGDRQG